MVVLVVIFVTVVVVVEGCSDVGKNLEGRSFLSPSTNVTIIKVGKNTWLY